MDFAAGFARCNEPFGILAETMGAISRSTRMPSRIFIIDNGDVPLDLPNLNIEGVPEVVTIIRPEKNIGCAGAWNLIALRAEEDEHWIDGPRPRTVILNADCAVAPDTFERMLAVPEPAVVLAYGFGCFLVDSEIRSRVGAFDAAFYPAYFEDADYRRRMSLAGVVPVEWPTTAVDYVVPGREKSAAGITHGSYDPDGYQGWRDDKLAWFWQCYENNRKRFLAKWGGEPGHEKFATPFDGIPQGR